MRYLSLGLNVEDINFDENGELKINITKCWSIECMIF